MSTATTNPLADHVLATLRAHEAELRAAGIRRLSLFGSVARGDHGPDSDVDVVAEIDRGDHFGLIELIGLENRIADLLCRKVDLVTWPVRKDRLRANIQRDAIHAF